MHAQQYSLLILILASVACSDKDPTLPSVNAAPSVNITSHTRLQDVYDAYTETFVGEVSDADHSTDDLLVTWYLGGRKICDAAPPESDGTTSCETIIQLEDDELELYVEDAKKSSASDTLSLTVNETGTPYVHISVPLSDGYYYADVPITFVGTISDEEDPVSDLVAAWQSDQDGLLKSVNATADDAGVVSGTGYLSAGDHVISLLVEDTVLKVGSDTVELTVFESNTAPECSIKLPSDGTIFQEEDTIEFAAIVSDVDVPNSMLTVSVESDVTGTLSVGTPEDDGDYEFEIDDLPIATHQITLTVVDEIGELCTDTIEVHVGTPPTVTVLTPITGDTYDEGAAIPFTASVTDGEDSLDTLSLSWWSDVDGEFSTEAADAKGQISFEYADLSIGAHSILVTATDSHDMRGEWEFDLVINAIPTTPEISISPDPASTTDDLSAVIGSESTDEDGDTVSYLYEWAVDGVTSSASTDVSLPSSATTRDELWSVTVTPTDGITTGVPATAEITISNTPPVVTDVVISPDPAYAADTLSCAWTYSDDDADDDASTVIWTVDGEIVGDETTLSGAFLGGQEVICTVTPSDGTDTGTDSAGSIVISNTVPVLASASISPDPAFEADTLTCNPGEITDVDGTTSFTYTYSWTVDGVDVGVTDATLTGTDFDRDQDVICSATPSDGEDDGDSVDSEPLTISNTAPSVSDVLISPDPAYADDTLSCGWTFADDDSDDDASTATWSVDGSEVGTGVTLTGEFLGGQEVTCWVTPDDGTDTGEVTSSSLTITNTPPVLTSVSLTPEEAYESDTLTCTPGDTTDIDSTTDFTYSYGWEVNGIDTGTSGASLSSDYFDRDQEVICIVIPNDGTEDGDAVESNAVTILNTAPTIDSVTLSPDPVYAADLLICSHQSYDDIDGDADESTYAWTLNGASIFAGYDLSGVFIADDVITCTVTPDDGDDEGEPITATITVTNTPPVLASVSISPDPAYEGDTLSCDLGSTTDDDGTTSFTYAYAWTVNGSNPGPTTSTLSADYWDRDDVIVCTVIPSDGEDDGDAVSSDSLTITNSEPVASNVSIAPEEAYAADTLSCSYDYSDADDDSDQSTLMWTVDGTDAGDDASLSGEFVGNQVVTCTITPYDGTDEGTEVSTSITIINTPPVLTAVTLSPDPAYEADTLVCGPGDVSDDDGTTSFTYSYEWTVDGETIETEEATLTGADFDRGQVVICTATPNDGDDDGEAVTSNELIISNTLPSIDSVSIDPSTPDVTSDLTCSYSGFDDDDDDDDSSTYSWSVDGSEVGTESTLSSGFVKGDVVTCTVTPYDGTDEGTSLSESVTILNSTPEVANVSIDPEDAYAADTLLCSYDFSDDDDDSDVSTISWTIDGTEVSSEATLAGEFIGGDEVTCTVTPSDGEEEGTAVSISVTIINTPPVLADVSLSPDPAYENDTITCTPGDTSDDDGTVGFDYTYEWTVDGVDIGVTDDEIDGSYFGRDEVVICTVTPSDGDDDGDAVSSDPLTISNTLPYIGTISVGPTAPTVTDTLTCEYTGFGDDDDDTDASTYSWTISGVEVGTESELSGSFIKDDSVTCEVTPDDGTDAGTSLSASITIVNTPPEIVDIALSPESPDTDDTLTVSVSTSDDDNDTVTLTYAWSVDGVAVGEDSASLSGDYFERDETITVEITPNDGEEDGDVASSSITIGNLAPSAPEVDIYQLPSATVGLGQGTHGCLINGEDEIECWGADDEGQVSDAADFDYDWVAVSTGQAHTCGVTDEKNVWCWGWDNQDQVSDSPNGSKYVDIAVGDQFSCALGTTGRAECWGRNDDDQADPPTTRFSHIYAGFEFGCGLTSDGEIECWGSDNFSKVTDAPSADGYTDVALGTYHGCAINEDGEIECWGCNSSDGCVYNEGQVDDIPSGDEFIVITAGAYHNCAMDVWGEVTCWGLDSEDQASPDAAIDSSGDAAPADPLFLDLWAGSDFSCGLSLDGDILCWGDSTDSQTQAPDISDSIDQLVCIVETASEDDDGDDIVYNFTWQVDGDDFTDPIHNYYDGDTVDIDDTLGGEEWTCTVTPGDDSDQGDSDSVSIVLDDCNSLSFDGTDDYIEMSTYPSFSPTSDFTVELWFKPDIDNDGTVLMWGEDWYIQMCSVGSGAIALEAEFGDSNCDDIRFEEWNFLAASWDVGTGVHQIYLNGAELTATAVGSSLIGGEPTMYVGRGDNGDYFNGEIADVAIFDEALSISTMEEHFQTGIDPDTETDLMGYWPIDEGAGTTVYDNTSFLRDGTIEDGTWADSCPDE